MPKWQTGLAGPAPTDIPLSVYFCNLVTLFVKNGKNAPANILWANVQFLSELTYECLCSSSIWTAPIILAGLSLNEGSARHPSSLPAASPLHLLCWEWPPPLLPNHLFYLLLLWHWKSSPLVMAAIMVTAEPLELEVRVRPWRIEGYSL